VKQILFALVLAAQVVFAQFVCGEDGGQVRVMTFNIRYGTAPDRENAWPNRKEMVLAVIRDFDPQLLGLQECLRDQLDAILQEFPDYSAVGVGREADGAGEYSPLVYDRTRFDVLQAETFWLSATPDVRASKSWGNEITRICTWARFVERSSNRVLRVYNTHWDHISQPSRVKSGELIARRLQESGAVVPTIVMGDLNIGPEDPARQPLSDAGLRDSIVDVHPEMARHGTFHGFSGKPNGDKIDAVLVSHEWKTLDAEIITTNNGGRYPSDHFPVTATLELKAGE
jgi:endonuclease/exonuclease/phosphatase family metal-dependent hydrolase